MSAARIVELGSCGKVHHTITIRPVTHYFPDPGTVNSLTGGLPTKGQWKETGAWTIEIEHVSGAKIWAAGTPHRSAHLQKELARALTLLAGWRILSDSAGELTIGARAG